VSNSQALHAKRSGIPGATRFQILERVAPSTLRLVAARKRDHQRREVFILNDVAGGRTTSGMKQNLCRGWASCCAL
jgi:hypothetical protein